MNININMSTVTQNTTIVLDRIFKSIPLVFIYFLLYKFQEYNLIQLTRGFRIFQTIILQVVLYIFLFFLNLILEQFIQIY